MSAPNSLLSNIGNTPIVQLRNILPANCADIFVKLESFNPTGSYKDRMALAIIEAAEQRGELKTGDIVVESTAGSTGTALALICSLKGYRFEVITSDAFAAEKLRAMKAFGAHLEIVTADNGKITPDLIPRMIAIAKAKGDLPGYYWTRQFENRDALMGYKIMGEEIIEQVAGKIDVFCAGVGTAGMLIGVADSLRAHHTSTQIIALEPTSSPMLSEGIKGSHTVDGIGVGIIPPMLSAADYDDVLAVDESEARATCVQLARKEGILAGTSTGINVAAAIRLGTKLGKGKTVVTVACDHGLKYMSGNLFD